MQQETLEKLDATKSLKSLNVKEYKQISKNSLIMLNLRCVNVVLYESFRNYLTILVAFHFHTSNTESIVMHLSDYLNLSEYFILK